MGLSPRISWVLIHFWLSLRSAAVARGGDAVRRRSCSDWRPRSRSDLLVAGFFFSGFLVDCGCGSVGFDLDRLGFSGGGAVRHFGWGQRPSRGGGFWFIFSSFLVDCGCGLVGFDLDRLGFSGSLVGFDDLAADWGWWFGWVVMMVVMVAVGLSERGRGSEGVKNKKL